MSEIQVRKDTKPDPVGRKLTVTTTASSGVNEKNTNLHDLQLHPETLEKLSSVTEGDFLKLVAVHGDQALEYYGRVEARDDRFGDGIGQDEIGVGIHCRRGLAVTPGDDIFVSSCRHDPIPSQRKLMNHLLKFRPAPCRVRKSISPDSGYKVCRLPHEVKDLIGIEWGDRVVIQSANARLHGMKALPLRDGLIEKFRTREKKKPDSYPPQFADTDLAEQAGMVVDIPHVHLSASARNELQLRDGGQYQPVKIHRDTNDVFIRLFDKLSIPIVLGAATIIVGFDISTSVKFVTFCVALVVAFTSISLHARRILLE